ncbi:MAG: hypothetical protein Ct9H90mP20_3860 [Candidatus Neomarinimicrobiota bacterium]|nr:MAG: hypothetical protein Ct9H90mP20_3860 [Candidatus Neomarinimicrobiota bacterium]
MLALSIKHDFDTSRIDDVVVGFVMPLMIREQILVKLQLSMQVGM